MCLMSERERLLEPNVGHFLSAFGLIFGKPMACADVFQRFLGATILPGNSEIVFISLAAPQVLVGSLLSADIVWLVFLATAGNTLGQPHHFTGLVDGFRKIDSKKMTALYGQ